MPTVDLRTRFEGDALDLGPEDLLDHGRLVAAMEQHGREAARAATRLGLPPLTLNVEDEVFTLSFEHSGVVARSGSSSALAVRLNRPAFSDLMQNVVSTFGVQMTGRAKIVSGTVDSFIGWEPVLRCLLDGRPAYEPGTIDFKDARGDPLDLRKSFVLGDAPEDIGHFLAQAGFLHIKGVFSPTEMAAVSADLDAAIAMAEPDDGASWWARTSDGTSYAARILGFNQRSATLRELLRSERFASIARFTEDDFVQRDPDVADSAEGLLKKVGVMEGISDVSWHKDCSMGGHSRHCCGLVVGISVTGANEENGELGVVPGSHRANISPLGIDGLDLPRASHCRHRSAT